MDKDVVIKTDDALKKINVALNLNSKKLKQKRIPPRLKKLVEWKNALEFWKVSYGGETSDIEKVSERVGAFYEICTMMG